LKKSIAATKLFEWVPELSVQIAEIDGEHKLWLDTMNRFHDSMLSGKGRDFFRAEFAAAAHLLLLHLGHEEELMTAVHYPGIRAQIQEHDGFRSTCGMFMDRFERDENALTVHLMLAVSVGTLRHAASVIRLAKYLRKNADVAVQDRKDCAPPPTAGMGA